MFLTTYRTDFSHNSYAGGQIQQRSDVIFASSEERENGRAS